MEEEAEEEIDDEASSMLKHIAVEAWDTHNMSMPFIFV